MTREMTSVSVTYVIIWDSRDEECDDGHYDIARILDTITRNVEDKSNYDTMIQCSFAGPDSTRPTLMPSQELSWHVSRPVKSYHNMVESVIFLPRSVLSCQDLSHDIRHDMREITMAMKKSRFVEMSFENVNKADTLL